MAGTATRASQASDALPWRRSIPAVVERRQFFFIALLFGFGGIAATIASLAVDDGVLWNRSGLLVVGLAALGVACWVTYLAVTDAPIIHRHFRAFAYFFLLGGGPLITLGQAMVGPVSTAASILYVAVPIFAMYHVPPWTSVVMTGLVSAEFGALVATQQGYVASGFTWAFVSGGLLVLGVVFGGLLGNAADEVDSLGRLRRFLPAAVADAVLSTPELLAPHRRQIAVLFCDLRGFTPFAATVEPEDVVEVLDEYYRTVGAVLDEANATVGTFAGDGIMAYFNDPLPVDDPAGEAVRVALALGHPMEALGQRWRDRGFDLSYGVGIAYGYATLGMFGFDGRNDYTALGPVVNLASRLCQAADRSEVLVDRRTADSLRGRADLSERAVALKGYDDPLTVFHVTDLRVGSLSTQ